MKSLCRPTRRTRLRLTLLAVLALLVQQTALAAYVCSSVGMPNANAGMTAHCEGMPMAQTQNNPALCALHCAHQPESAQTAHVPQIPPSTLAAVLPPTPLVLALPLTHLAHARDSGGRSRGIPPALRYRVLLI